MKITIVGTGYVGLVTGACFAEIGLNVTCIDIDEKKIAGLKNGVIPIYEPGLEKLVLRNYKNGRLQFSTRLSEHLQDTQAVFIAVGTPSGEDGSADLQYVIQVASEIGEAMNDYLVLVTKSTVPVGTAKQVREAVETSLANRNKTICFDVASNPEFLKEGAAIDDFMRPDRIVVGIESERSKKVLELLYRPFVLNGHPIYFMDITSAEMTKYAANSMLATKISFINDVANLCELVGADVNMVRKGIGSDIRIGTKFIYPGVGYGGSCFPKDVKALIKTADENGYSMQVLKAVESVNENQKSVMSTKLIKHFGQDLTGMTFAIWGLSFKPNTDDMREAPSIVVIKNLIERGAKIRAFDPVAMHEVKKDLGNSIFYASNEYDALQGAEALLIMTEWDLFKAPNFSRIKQALNTAVIFDGRNIYDGKYLREQGFTHYGIGVPEN